VAVAQVLRQAGVVRERLAARLAPHHACVAGRASEGRAGGRWTQMRRRWGAARGTGGDHLPRTYPIPRAF